MHTVIQGKMYREIIAPKIRAGIEIGSLTTFYSLENIALGDARYTKELTTKFGKETTELTASIKLPDATFRFTEIETNASRELSIVILDTSVLMDAVLRFTFPVELVDCVLMDGKEVKWARKNRYHQKTCPEIEIRLKTGDYLKFKMYANNLPANMELLGYVRDEPTKWVMHIRARAKIPDVVLFRGCHAWWNKPAPMFFQKILKKFPSLLQKTLYIRERISQRIPFQTNGAVLLNKGTNFKLGVSWTRTNHAK